MAEVCVTWQPIETAPQETKILVVWNGGVTIAVYRDRPYHNRGRGSGWRIADHPSNPWLLTPRAPSWWMPLPERPRIKP